VARSILVTGGNRGIGLATAQAFADLGDHVAVTTRGGEVPDHRLLVVPADMTDPDSVTAAVSAAEDAHGPLEVLVANAGITRDTLLLRMSEEDWSAMLETNLTGAFRVAKRAARSMLRQRRGRIVLVSSVVALSGSAGQANYAASKAGVIGMSKSLAQEVASRGITVNAIAPGFIATAMTDKLNDEQKARISAGIPAGRMGTVDEVAAAAVFLASEEAGYVTGQTLHVNGGMAMI
jgi:3-oxoacyl-[acyl-carrier protein] reductase